MEGVGIGSDVRGIRKGRQQGRRGKGGRVGRKGKTGWDETKGEQFRRAKIGKKE